MTLKFEQAPDLWAVRADEGQISNAIVNLVVNARDAMPPEGGTVTIRISNVTLPTARPVGAGLDAAGRLRADRSGRYRQGHRAGESGQDLRALLHHQARRTRHGPRPLDRLWRGQADGRLHRLSRASSARARPSRVYLPRYVADRRRARSRVDEPDRAAHRDITGQDTILLVEDEDAVRSFAARALRMRGYTVLEAPRRRGRARHRAQASGRDRSRHLRRRDAQHGRAHDGARGAASSGPRCA